MSDTTRRRGFLGDLSRQAATLRGIDGVRVLDRIASRLAVRQGNEGELDLGKLRQVARDRWGRDLEDDGSRALDEAIAVVADVIAAEDREHEELQERAREEILGPPTSTLGAGLCIGLPGDDLGDPVAVPVDSDAPATTYGAGTDPAHRCRTIRVVVDEPGEPLGGGDA